MFPTDVTAKPDQPSHRQMTDRVHTQLNERPHVTRWNSIQAAIDALPASGGELYLPAGQYALSDTLLYRSNINLVGAGKHATRVAFTGSGAAITSATPGARTYRLRLAHLTLTTTSGAVGLDFADMTGAFVENVLIAGFSQAGIHIRGAADGNALYNVLTAVDVSNSPVGFLVDAKKSHENSFYSCRALNCADAGFRVVDSGHNKLFGCAIEVCGIGLHVTGARSLNNHAITCRFENDTVGVQQDAGAQGTVSLLPHYGGNSTNEIGL